MRRVEICISDRYFNTSPATDRRWQYITTSLAEGFSGHWEEHANSFLSGASHNGERVFQWNLGLTGLEKDKLLSILIT